MQLKTKSIPLRGRRMLITKEKKIARRDITLLQTLDTTVHVAYTILIPNLNETLTGSSKTHTNTTFDNVGADIISFPLTN